MQYQWSEEDARRALEQWLAKVKEERGWGSLTFLVQNGVVVTIKLEETYKKN